MSWDQSSTPSPSSIGDVPVEILHDIFALACVDGGKTGCALAQVSRHIRGASRAVRFRIVSLPYGSLWKLRAFVDDFTRAQEDAARERATVPRVYHLCVAVAVRWGEDPSGANAIREMEACSQSCLSETRLESGDESAGCLVSADDTPMPIGTVHSSEHLSCDSRTSATHPQVPEYSYPRISQEYCAIVRTVLARFAADLDSLCLLGPHMPADEREKFWKSCWPFLPDPEPFFRMPEMPPFVRLRELSLSGDAFQDVPLDTQHDLLRGIYECPRLFPELERIVMALHDVNPVYPRWWLCTTPAAKVRQLQLVVDCEQDAFGWFGGVYDVFKSLPRRASDRRMIHDNTYRPALDISSVCVEFIARLHPYPGPDCGRDLLEWTQQQERTIRNILTTYDRVEPFGHNCKFELWLPEGTPPSQYPAHRVTVRPVSVDALSISLDDVLRQDWLQRAFKFP